MALFHPSQIATVTSKRHSGQVAIPANKITVSSWSNTLLGDQRFVITAFQFGQCHKLTGCRQGAAKTASLAPQNRSRDIDSLSRWETQKASIFFGPQFFQVSTRKRLARRVSTRFVVNAIQRWRKCNIAGGNSLRASQNGG